MSVFASIHPLVLTLDGYRDAFGEDSPEELAALQAEDVELAALIGEVLDEVMAVTVDLTQPQSGEGSTYELGHPESLEDLKGFASQIAGRPLADFLEGRVPVGSQFQHLINHSGVGYYLPIDFLQPFYLEERELSVGSAVQLLADLRALEPHIVKRYEGILEADPDALPDHFGRVWRLLILLCEESLASGLPFEMG